MRKQHEKPVIIKDKKQCTQCKVFKLFSEFHKFGKSPDGYKHFCKECVRKYDQNENDAIRIFPRKLDSSGNIHCRNCGEYFPENEMKQSKNGMYKGLSYCTTCAPILRHTRNIERYGLTMEQYHKLLEDQNYGCKICGLKESTYRKRLSVDHDHSCCPGSRSCGKCVRGLLCHHCNAALGNSKDNVETLQKMINYLKHNFSENAVY
jgi:Pyruvate/2-oxoacid:ferredoxin oxidoreductase delta subunit